MKYLFFLSIIPAFLIAKIEIAVSIAPQETFVKKIAKDKVKVFSIVKPGHSPHSYEPKPSEIKKISKAQIYFPIKIEFENVWLDKFIMQNKHMKVIEMTKGINFITMKKHKKHNNEKKPVIKPDPHTWTSPLNVKIMAKNIYEALIEIDEQNKEFYKTNYLNFLKEINLLDEKISNILIDVKTDSKFMVFHPAWGYFARDYALKQFPVQIEGKEPKPKELIKIIQQAKKENIKAIFTQSEFSTKSAQTIADALKIRVIKESPLAQDWGKNLLKMANTIANTN